jgi:hypothetical protein
MLCHDKPVLNKKSTIEFYKRKNYSVFSNLRHYTLESIRTDKLLPINDQRRQLGGVPKSQQVLARDAETRQQIKGYGHPRTHETVRTRRRMQADTSAHQEGESGGESTREEEEEGQVKHKPRVKP